MSLQFIFGNSGAGKSWNLNGKTIEQSMEHPKRNYLVLVPEQFTMQTQKELVERHPNHGIINIDVLSFGRLAHRIFEEVGQEKMEILDDVGKNLILRKVAEDCKDSLKVLRGNLKKIGYITEVKSIISEFIQYDLSMERLEQLLNEVPEGDSLHYKLEDLRMVLEQYNRYMGENYISKEELLEVLCQVVPKSKILKDSVVTLDGFTGFTPVQNRLIGELLKVCHKVVITVTLDEREDPYVLKHPYQLFVLSKQTVVNLSQIAKDCNVEIEEPICLYQKPVYRFRKNAPLAHLEEHLFRYDLKKYEEAQEQIEIHVARTMGDEVAYVAQEIRKLVRKGGYSYAQIAVITADINHYSDAIEKEFQKFQIPVFMDQKRSVLLNPFVEYIRSLLCMLEQNYTYETVFRYLRTGLAGFCNYEIDVLENYILAMGIKGYKRWSEPWLRTPRGGSQEELAVINALRIRFVESITAVHQVLKQSKKTVRAITQALYEHFLQEKIQSKLLFQEQIFEDAGELALAKEYHQIFGIVIELFDKFVELLGSENLPLKEYNVLLDAGFEEAKVGVIPPGMNQVVIGDMERTRLKDIKAMFFVGAVDSVLPGNLSKGGLLSERDRRIVKENKQALSPDGKEKAYIQKFYLYLDLTKPTEKLYLSYSKVNGEGKAQRPAYLISDVKKMFPQLLVIEEEHRAFADMEFSEDTAIDQVITGLRTPELLESDTCIRQLYTWYYNSQKWQEKLCSYVEAGFYQKPQDALSQKVAEQIYGKEFQGSISRLENFGACAYAHFLRYGLLLKERPLHEFQPVDMGNVFHKSMEKYALEMKNRGNDWSKVTKEEQIKLADQYLEESIADYDNGVLYQSSRDTFAIHRMKRMLHRTIWALTRQLERGDFATDAVEYSFGRGKIDRIDTAENDKRVYVKVVDYKTGSKSFDIVSFYYGLQMQLIVYMNEAMQMESRKNPQKEIVPAGIFYYQVKDPMLTRKEGSAELEPEQREQAMADAMLTELKPDGLIMEDPFVIEHLDHEFEKKSMVIPVGKTKTGWDAASKLADEESFRDILEYSKQIEQEQNEKIKQGDIEIAPFELGQETGCDFCAYRSVCHFDTKIKGYQYRRLKKLSKIEVAQKMKEKLGREDV